MISIEMYKSHAMFWLTYLFLDQNGGDSMDNN